MSALGQMNKKDIAELVDAGGKKLEAGVVASEKEDKEVVAQANLQKSENVSKGKGHTIA